MSSKRGRGTSLSGCGERQRAWHSQTLKQRERGHRSSHSQTFPQYGIGQSTELYQHSASQSQRNSSERSIGDFKAKSRSQCSQPNSAPSSLSPTLNPDLVLEEMYSAFNSYWFTFDICIEALKDFVSKSLILIQVIGISPLSVITNWLLRATFSQGHLSLLWRIPSFRRISTISSVLLCRNWNFHVWQTLKSSCSALFGMRFAYWMTLAMSRLKLVWRWMEDQLLPAIARFTLSVTGLKFTGWFNC